MKTSSSFLLLFFFLGTWVSALQAVLILASASSASLHICQKSRRIGCVIPGCKLKCGLTQTIPPIFGHIRRLLLSSLSQALVESCNNNRPRPNPRPPPRPPPPPGCRKTGGPQKTGCTEWQDCCNCSGMHSKQQGI